MRYFASSILFLLAFVSAGLAAPMDSLALEARDGNVDGLSELISQELDVSNILHIKGSNRIVEYTNERLTANKELEQAPGVQKGCGHDLRDYLTEALDRAPATDPTPFMQTGRCVDVYLAKLEAVPGGFNILSGIKRE